MRNFKNFQKNCQHLESLTFLRAVTFMFYPLKPQTHTWGAAAQILKEKFKKIESGLYLKETFRHIEDWADFPLAILFRKLVEQFLRKRKNC